ncbi:MAG: 30S ribosomal protein S4 [Candidatus Pacearchaeota archaeon]|jgi:small subunit ribosomal protein S4
MIRKHKKFIRPKKAFDAKRIEEENVIVEKYGLKSKREIWKAKAKLKIIRNTAKALINEDAEKQEIFLTKLRGLGFNVTTPVDVLALTEEDILKRRLQTVLLNKKLATTAKGARQLITHKHVSVEGKIVNIPSYMVPIKQENSIKVLITLNKTGKPKETIKKPEEIVEEIENE